MSRAPKLEPRDGSSPGVTPEESASPHALVTGASSGIGEAIAVELAAAGWDLTLVARRRGELERVAASLEGTGQAEARAADVGDLGALDELVSAAEASLGPLDVLVNNAGVQIVAPTPSVDPEHGERLFGVNVHAPFRLTHAALRRMIPRGRGTIVDVASLSALAPTSGMFHYSASKAALAAASESLRAEVAPHGVHVVTVYPGPIETPMAQRAVEAYAEDPLGGLPVGDARTLARRVRRAIERRHDRVIYPRFYALTRLFPGTTRALMDRFGPIPRRLPAST